MNKEKQHVRNLEDLINNPSLEAFNKVILSYDDTISIKASEIESIFKNNTYEDGMKLINKKIPDYKDLMKSSIILKTEAEGGSSEEYLHEMDKWDSLDSFIRAELNFLKKMQKLNVLDEDYILIPNFLDNLDEDEHEAFYDTCYEYFCIPTHYATEEAYEPDEINWESIFKEQDLLYIRMLSMQIYRNVTNYLF